MGNWSKPFTLAGAIFGASFATEAEEKQSFQVKVNVSIPAHEMYPAIARQAQGACQKSVQRSILLNYNASKVAKCRSQMVSDVIKRLDLPRLTVFHEQTTHSDIKAP